MRTWFTVFALVALVSGCRTNPQEDPVEKNRTGASPKPAKVDEQAAAVIARAVDAIGGRAALQDASTYSYTGSTVITAGSFHQEEPFTLYEKAPGRSYYETPIGRRKLIFATNGEMAWTQNDGALAPYRMPDEEAAGVIRRAVFNRFYFGMADRGVNVVYLGEQEVEAIDSVIAPERLSVLAYVYPDGDTVRAHFSLETGRLRMTARNILTSIGPSPVQVWFGDYRPVGNLFVSHSNTTLFPGEKHLTTVSETKINEPIEDEIFELASTPTLTRDQLAALVGTYEFEDDVSVEIAFGDAGLLYRRGEDHPLPLVAINDTLFLVGTGHDLRNLEFARPIDGRSPHLRISKGEDGQVLTNTASGSR